MKINWIEYENTRTGLKIDRVRFYNNLTLLVGLSGAGKTTILNAVSLFQDIVNRKYRKEMFDTVLIIGFEIESKNYEWHIKFGKNEELNNYKDEKEEKNIKIPVLEEYFLIDGEFYFKKDSNGIIYNGKDMPGLSQTMSCINLFDNDYIVQKIVKEFHYISMYSTYSIAPKSINPVPYKVMERFGDNGNDVINSFIQEGAFDYAFYVKLCLLQENEMYEIFDKIKQSYINIFNTVEDLYFEFDKSTYSYTLYQKEKDVISPISIDNFSSGMLKILIFLTNLYTCEPGFIFLIDELENSFGVNCLDAMVEIIQDCEEDFQFIITSHHPYIINNIDVSDWNIVERKGSVINAIQAKDLKIGSTRRDAFFELINYWKFHLMKE